MFERPAHRNPNIAFGLRCLGACLLVCVSALAQVVGPERNPSVTNNETETVVGCLAGGLGAFQLSDSEGYVYRLTGHTSGMEKYAGEEISVRGTKKQPTGPIPSLNVISFRVVFRAPAPKLSASISDQSNWNAQASQEFGIKFALP